MSRESRQRVLAVAPTTIAGDGRLDLPVTLVEDDSRVLALDRPSSGGEAVATVNVLDGTVVDAQLRAHATVRPIDVIRRADRSPVMTLPNAQTALTAMSKASLERYDRQVRVFGSLGQETLRRLHVGVVGAGGTGSATVEQLARLGVGRLTVLDDDVVTESNLTRIHQSAPTDVGSPKVSVAARLATDLGVTCEAVARRVTEREGALRLRTCDVVFGCTDDHAGRLVLARLVPRCLQLLIDVGVTIDAIDGAVVGAPCRLSVQHPGDLCLLCRGVIDPSVAAAELLDPRERLSRAGEGYVPGLGEPDPSVVSYTTLAASVAVSELLARLFGFGEDRPGDSLIDPVAGRCVPISRSQETIDECTDPAIAGVGDAEPFLGLSW